MSMSPCPGCGLPRDDEQIGVVPCPVCAAGGTDSPDLRPGLPKKPAGPDPTAGLPADTSELHRQPYTGGFPLWFAGAFLFALGVAAGVVGVLGWQTASRTGASKKSPVEVAENRLLPALPTRRVEVAPMPREWVPRPVQPVTPPEPPPVPKPDPKITPEPPQPGRVVTFDLNDPNATFTLPTTMRKGEHVVLRGEVKLLKLTGLDAGAVLDASGLKAAEVTVSGKIDNRSVLKLNAPNGVVSVNAVVVGRSTVEVHAPGGEVRFGAKGAKTVAQIDAGSVVTVNARGVEVRGEVNGVETKVTVTLPPTGWLRVGAVRGIATVEYRVTGGKGTADVTVGTVSPTANFRKIE